MVTANGRLADGTWVRVDIDAETQQVGCVGGLPEQRHGFPRLAVVDVDSDTVYAPMQAFYFASAIGDSPCAEAPDSGILIQSVRAASTCG
ncbi:MAG: hypothetical protein U0694_16560 [Anaerolineae bacterium]